MLVGCLAPVWMGKKMNLLFITSIAINFSLLSSINRVWYCQDAVVVACFVFFIPKMT